MASVQRRAREKAQTREKILAAARDLVLRHGFDAVSLRQIARSIEYTAPAIYTHFKDKHEMLAALCEQDFALLRGAMRHADRIDDPVERLRQIGRAYVRFGFEHPHHYRFMFMEPWPEGGPSPEDLPPGQIEQGNPDQDAYAFLKQAVTRCIEAGRFKARYADPDVVTTLCWGAAHGVVSLYLTHGGDPWVDFKAPQETAMALLDASLDGMLAQPAAGRVRP